MLQRADVVQGFLSLFPNANYLEVGVDSGLTFHALNAARKTAVDPHFKFDSAAAAREYPSCAYHSVTSDDFFGKIADPKERFDVIYLDGLHTLEQTLRDLMNGMAFLSEDGVIIVDDVLPSSYDASLPDLDEAFTFKRYFDPEVKDASWMGDVYRLVFFVQTFCQAYSYATVGENHGQMVMWRGVRAAPDHADRTVEWISRLSFAALLSKLDDLRIRPYSDIVDLYRRSRQSGGRAPQRMPGLYCTALTKAQAAEGGFHDDITLLQPDSPLTECAGDRRTLAPAERYDRPDPAFLGGVDPQARTILMQHFAHTREAYGSVAPVSSILLKTAVVKGDVIYLKDDACHRILYETYRRNDRPYVQLAEEDCLKAPARSFSEETRYGYLGSAGSFNYGHWLVDDLARVAVAKDQVEDVHWLMSSSGTAMDQVKADSLRRVAGPEARITFIDGKEAIAVKNLIYLTPVSYHPAAKSPLALQRLRDIVASSSRPKGRKLFVNRGEGEPRQITNMEALLPLLDAACFERIRPADFSFDDQARLFAEADVVLGIMGAAMSNTIFCNPATKIGYLAPSGWTEPFYWDLASALKQDYRCLFGKTEAAPEKVHLKSFNVAPENLAELIDALSVKS